MNSAPMLTLRKPTAADSAAIEGYRRAVHYAGLPLHGATPDLFPDVASWLAFHEAPAGTLLPNGVAKVADSTWLGWDGERMVGIINLRHELNDFLQHYGGHIGYSVHPACWNRGYATQMLALALRESDALGLRELLLTCSPDNPASKRVIEKNGGVLERIGAYRGERVCSPDNALKTACHLP